MDVDSEAVERAVRRRAGGPVAGADPDAGDARRGSAGALDALPEAFRQAVWLRDVEELSYAEMAHVLDVPIGTVMSRHEHRRLRQHGQEVRLVLDGRHEHRPDDGARHRR